MQQLGTYNFDKTEPLRGKGEFMKHFMIIVLLFLKPIAMADGHSEMGLKKRQADAAMKVTSVVLGQEMTSISAEGGMEGYGQVYATYDLTYNRNAPAARSMVKAVALLKKGLRLDDSKASGSLSMA